MARFIYPNVTEDNRDGRGSLSARLEQAGLLGCEWAEVPADPVRDAREAEVTGLAIGAILDATSVARLYATSDAPVPDGKYILHAETPPGAAPSSESHRAGPLWSDKQWANRFAEMLLIIAQHLGSAPAAVEIQSGDRGNSLADIIFGARVIHDRLEKNLGFEPQVWLENCSGQAVQSGKELAAFWQVVWRTPRLPPWLGVVLDVDHLWMATESSFEAELESIPDNAVRALHVHRRGGVPSFDDVLPWDRVFARPFAQARGLPVLPKVQQRADVPRTIQFCKQQLADETAAGPMTK